MYIVHVFIEVKPEYLDDFIAATIANAEASIKEPGIARFDFLRDAENPNHFVLVEVYRTNGAPAMHKQTEHYQKWKETVEPMMAAPRSRRIFDNIVPDENGWDSL
jgi:quinol monooxygenase YgiN